MMSAPMERWISTTDSGLKKCFEPSICDLNVTLRHGSFGFRPGNKPGILRCRSGSGRPAVEAVKATCFFKKFHSGTKVQMVGIPIFFMPDVVMQLSSL